MTELQGAVALAQLGKLEASVNHRIEMAARLTRALDGLPGIETPWVHPDNRHVYWKYVLRVDRAMIPGGPGRAGRGPEGLRRRLARPRYIQKPAFRCAIFATSGPSAPAAARSRWRGPRRSTTPRSGSRARSRRWKRCSCCPGTSGTSRPRRLPRRGDRPRPWTALAGVASVSDSIAFGLVGAGGIAQAYVQVFAGSQGGSHRGGGRRSPRGGGQRRRSPGLRCIRLVGGVG